MRIAVLGATGATGRHLLRESLKRGHTVVAIARHPQQLEPSLLAAVMAAPADVSDPGSVVRAVEGADVVLSGLGAPKHDAVGVLTAGAKALAEAEVKRVIWLGAFGTGRSADVAGSLVRNLLKIVLRAELADKATADDTILELGGTVFHAGPLSNRQLSPTHRSVDLSQMPRQLLPPGISRATVAAVMLDEAEDPRHQGRIAVPLS